MNLTKFSNEASKNHPRLSVYVTGINTHGVVGEVRRHGMSVVLGTVQNVHVYTIQRSQKEPTNATTTMRSGGIKVW